VKHASLSDLREEVALLLARSRHYPRADHLYIAVTIYTVSRMPAFGVLVIRTNERGGATAVRE